LAVLNGHSFREYITALENTSQENTSPTQDILESSYNRR